TPEKRSALKSSEVQRETRSAKKQDATHNSEEDIAKGSGTSTKCNSPEIPEKSRKRQKKDKEVQKAAAVTA
ncbi:3070_t:CDS:2, partial [Gigaspora rosea]